MSKVVRQTEIADVVVALTRKFKGDYGPALLSDGDTIADVREWIPSGFVGFDQILGGGWAVGRASEVSGEEGCGKTALAQLAMRSVQAMGGFVIYLDFELACDSTRMRKMGIDPTRVVYHAPEYIEQAWDIIWTAHARLVEKPPTAPVLIVWDSVGASIAKIQREADSSEDLKVGAVARAMSSGCARMYYAIAQVRAHMMWVNQQRKTIGGFSRFGPPPTTTPGGEQLRFAASQRVECHKVMQLKAAGNSGPASGYLIRAKTLKNRGAPPHQKVQWVLDFEYGPSPELTIYQTLLDHGAIRKVLGCKPGEFEWSGAKGVRFTRTSWIDLLRNDASYCAKVEPAYCALVAAQTRPAKPGDAES